jgi:FKBP-type peptidyl-prolyl cis-trans isomerase SlyD
MPGATLSAIILLPGGHHMMRAISLAALLALATAGTALAQGPVAPAPAAPVPAPADAPAIEPGSTVHLEYTLRDDAGALLDSNKGQSPLTYTQGDRQLLHGLERQLAGMHAGEERHVVLAPEEAFGPVDPAAQAEVSKDALPAGALVVGTRLVAQTAAGERRPVVVREIKDSTVVIDLNHPLAGKTLVFDVKVLSIDAPKAPAPAEVAPTAPAAPGPAAPAEPKPAK